MKEFNGYDEVIEQFLNLHNTIPKLVDEVLLNFVIGIGSGFFLGITLIGTVSGI